MSFGTLEIRYNYYPILKLICTFLCDLRKIYFELFENKFYKTWLKLWLLAFLEALFNILCCCVSCSCSFCALGDKGVEKVYRGNKISDHFHNTSIPLFSVVVGSVIS